MPIHSQNLNAIRPAVCEIWKTGFARAHVQTPFSRSHACVKLLSNRSLFTHKILTRSAQPFARSGKRGVHVRTCRFSPPLHCLKEIVGHKPNLNVIGQAVVELPRVWCLRHPLTQRVPRAVTGTGVYRCRSNTKLIGW